MDSAALKPLEERASAAEQRLAALESKLAGEAPTLSGFDVGRYVEELKGLRDMLVAALAEQEVQAARIVELETSNSKLAYQVTHLKRAVKEGDEKAAKLAAGS